MLTTHSMEEAEALSSRMAIQAGVRGSARARAATAELYNPVKARAGRSNTADATLQHVGVSIRLSCH